MRYYTKEGALLLRGLAFAAGTGLSSRGEVCHSIVFAPVPPTCPGMPAVPLAVACAGLDGATTAGFSTRVGVEHAVVTQYDGAMAFALADGDAVLLVAWTPASISSDDIGPLLTAIEEACPVPPSALLLAWDGREGAVRAGPLREAAAAAVAEARARSDSPSGDGPAFFIYSRFGGGHWVGWTPEACPYYPCHHREGQRCEYCYCPLYPCGDTSLGEEVASSTAGAVWNCSSCTLLHEPAVADHLVRNPMATLAELKRVASRP